MEKAASFAEKGAMSQAPEVREGRAGVVFGALFLLLPVVMMACSLAFVRKADFSCFYPSGLIVRQGHAAKLYDMDEQLRVQEQVLGRKGVLINPHPPMQAILFAPLSLLSYRGAYVAWGMINVLLWVLFVYLLRNYSGVKDRPLRYLLLGCMFPPLWIALVMGQFSLIVLVAFTLALVCMKREQDYLAGLGLSLGLLKFTALLPFAAILLLRRKWKFIAGFSTGAALQGLLSLAVVGWSGVVSYVRLLVDVLEHPSYPEYAVLNMTWNQPNIGGIVTVLLSRSVSAHWISAVSAGLSGCAILFAAWYWQREEKPRYGGSFDLMFAAALVISLLATPHLYEYDLTPMLLAIVLVMASPEWAANSKERYVLIAAVAILYASSCLSTLTGQQMLWVLAPVLATFAVGTLTLARKTKLRVQNGAETAAPYDAAASADAVSVNG
jgi:hypothetical protein